MYSRCKNKRTNYFIKVRDVRVRLISCLLDSNRNSVEDVDQEKALKDLANATAKEKGKEAKVAEKTGPLPQLTSPAIGGRQVSRGRGLAEGR